MKCYLYILKNAQNKHYIGITKLLPQVRLIRHNKGDVYSTKFGRPWKLIYTEEYDDMKLARNREKQIKRWHGGATLKRFLNKSAESSNGRTPDSGSGNLGSNPSSADLFGNKNLTG